MSIKEHASIKERLKRAKIRATIWCEEHAAALSFCALSGIIGASVCAWLVDKHFYVLPKNVFLEALGTNASETDVVSTTSDLNESYAEHLNMINDVVDKLTLQPGEVYVIENNIVTQLVDAYGKNKH